MPGDDVIGIALKNYLLKGSETPIQVFSNVTDPDVIEPKHLFREEEEFSQVELLALERCTGKILDVGAGSGVHSLVLQKRGASVQAIDTSPGAVQVMLQRGVHTAKCLNFYDIENEKFDTLLFLMNGLGIAGNLEGLTVLLKKAKQILHRGGQVLLDSSDIRYLFEEDDGSIRIDLNRFHYGEVEYTMKYEMFESAPFKWLFLDYNTLREIAFTCGFEAELLLEEENDTYLARLTPIGT